MTDQAQQVGDPSLPLLVVFKGGTAFNGLVGTFRQHFPRVSYVIPISDDGGSSREICRVLGGPSIGDLRSTLTRLSDESTEEARAVKRLLEHRLPAEDGSEGMAEWRQLLEDSHPLYAGISSPYRGLIRCFLCKFEAERLQRIAHGFDMRNCSVGNCVFTGARIVLGSLETAIFVYSGVAKIHRDTSVLPVIDSSDRLTIAAKLDDGQVIVGQQAISHPSKTGVVDKETWVSLPAPIRELFYVNKYGDRISPQVNPSIPQSLDRSGSIVYGVGSLWTSLIPSLILDGVGEVIATRECPKVGLLNSCPDRETERMTAYDYVMALTEALNRYGALSHPPRRYLTHLAVVEDTTIPVEETAIESLGIEVCRLRRDAKKVLLCGAVSHAVYDAEAVVELLQTLVSTYSSPRCREKNISRAGRADSQLVEEEALDRSGVELDYRYL